MSRPADPPLDVERILAAFDRHEVAYLLVGGVAARTHGATYPTYDLDCVADRALENLERVAAALRDLNARLRVHGLDDEEAARLPVDLTGQTLAHMEISTWRTDAGDLDVLAHLRGRDGNPIGFEVLRRRGSAADLDGYVVQVAALADVIAAKEYANRPKDQRQLAELYALQQRRRGPGRAR